jgi:hypothetical protein
MYLLEEERKELGDKVHEGVGAFNWETFDTESEWGSREPVGRWRHLNN